MVRDLLRRSFPSLVNRNGESDGERPAPAKLPFAGVAAVTGPSRSSRHQVSRVRFADNPVIDVKAISSHRSLTKE